MKKFLALILFVSGLFAQNTPSYPGSVATNTILPIATNNATTVLTGSMTNIQTTISVASASLFTTPTILWIDGEAIRCTGKTTNSFTGCTRGFDNTTAATHSSNVTVSDFVVAWYVNQLTAEVIAVETDLNTGLPAVRGGTDQTVPTLNNVLVGTGTIWGKLALPTSCTTGINYDSTGPSFSCVSAGVGANQALSNLASVSINTSLLAQASVDLGSTVKPFRNLYLYGSGTYGTNYFKFDGTPSSTRTITFPDANSNTIIPDGGASNNFLTAISSGGVISKAQPAFTNLSGSATTSQLPTVSKYRTCMMDVGSDNAGSVLVDADLGPQGRLCFIAQASTVVEVTVAADGGTPSVIARKNHAGSGSNFVSGALATASSGGIACSNIGGTTGLDGATTCSGTLQNTSLAAGDWIELISGTAGGVAKRMSIAVTFTVN